MSGFKSIIIPSEVIIVENKNGQGYVVPKGNDKVLASAKSWAKTYDYNHETKEQTVQEGAEHCYTNGKFQLKLHSSAGYSWNGGKLSFWDCDITAPDGKVFRIGINSFLLCDLLQNCTLVKGVVQEDVWLGREATNTGAYVENMPQFQQAKDEEIIRQERKKKTTKYEIGDIVGTLTQKSIYAGVVYRYWDLFENYTYGGSWKDRTIRIVKSEDLVPYHLYIPIANDGTIAYDDVYSSNLYTKKRSICKLDGHVDGTTREHITEAIKHFHWSHLPLILTDDLASPILTKEEIFEKYSSKSNGYNYTMS